MPVIITQSFSLGNYQHSSFMLPNANYDIPKLKLTFLFQQLSLRYAVVWIFAVKGVAAIPSLFVSG